MKILLINDNHNATGGAENYFFDLKSQLKQTNGIEVYSLGFGEKEKGGSDYYVFKALKSNFAKLIARFIPHPLLLKRIHNQIILFQPDVIHLHNIKQYSATILSAVNGYPVVQTTHDFSAICPTSQNIHRDLSPCVTGLSKECFWQHRVKFNPITYFLMFLSWKSINHKLKQMVGNFLSPSPLLATYLHNNGFTPASYIPPFMKTIKYVNRNKVEVNRFLFAGSLATHKGVHLLLNEFADAVKIKPSLMLDIAGTGPLEKKLRKKVTLLKLAHNVRFLGWEKNLDSYYQQATALIFPSIGLESFGLVVTEAMCNGRAVIGVNRGTTAWLVEDGKSGLLFDPLKKGDLADKILRLANNPESAHQMGELGQRRVSELFDNKATLEDIIKIYRHASSHS